MIIWDSGNGWIPYRSACLGYQIVRLASPEYSWVAEHRPSLYDRVACGPVRYSIEEAQADAEADLANLQQGLPRFSQKEAA